MSKVDAMRALREARFAARPAAPVRQRTAVQAPPPARAAAPTAAPETEPGGPRTALCGHRNIGGRSCTREVDHQKAGTKNHRYG